MQLFVYGKLRSDGPFNFLLPKKNTKKKEVMLNGFQIHNLGRSLGAVRADARDQILCELWTFSMPKYKERIMLFVLDLYENFLVTKYQRVLIPSEYGEGWIYLYTGDVTNKKDVNF
jgi:gamma-glutamylcyclotransferase (GGCT)/AIG2-like uncharacterized protein YtfP